VVQLTEFNLILLFFSFIGLIIFVLAIIYKPELGIGLLIATGLILAIIHRVTPVYIPIGYILLILVGFAVVVRLPNLRFKFNQLDLFMAIYLIYGIILLCFFSEKKVSVWGFNYHFKPIIIYFYVRFLLLGKKSMKFFWLLSVGIALFVCLDGLYHYLFNYSAVMSFYNKIALAGPKHAQMNIPHYLSQKRMASIYYPMITGIGVAAMVAYFNVWGQLIERRKYRNYIDKVSSLFYANFLKLMMLVFLSAIVLNLSRSAWVATFIGSVIMLYYSRVNLFKLFKSFSMVIIIIVATVMIFAKDKEQLMFRVRTIFQPSIEYQYSDHYGYLSRSVKEFFNFPFGKGLGKGLVKSQVETEDSFWAESSIFQIALEQGFFGVILFSLIFFKAFKLAKNSLKWIKEPFWRGIARSTISNLVSFFVAMIAFPHWSSFQVIFIFATMGCIVNEIQRINYEFSPVKLNGRIK